MAGYQIPLMQMQPMNALMPPAERFDAGTVINALRMGESDGRQAGQFQARQRAGNALAAGDYKGSAGELLRAGDIEGGMKVDQAGILREKQEFDRKYGALVVADTPQKWAQTIQSFQAAGVSVPPDMADFRNRERVMSQMFTTKERMDQYFKQADDKRADAQLGMQQAAAGRDAQLHPFKLDLLKAQTEQAREKNVLNEAIGGMIRGATQPQQSAPQSPIRPQSFEGGDGDPMLIPTQAAAPQAQPAMPMVDTPMGKMPSDKARQLGFALGLAGKGDAGKMMFESGNAGTLGKEGQNELDKKVIAASDNLANLSAIQMRFKPEFLQLQSMAGMKVAELKDKIGQLPAQEQQKLSEFAAFRADSVDALNQYIKSVTGAAMTEAEAQRLMKAFPNAGTGIFDGDSPAQFKSKLDSAALKIKMSLARYNYAKQNGQNWQTMGLEQFSRRIYSEGRQLEQDFLRKGMSDREADGAVRSEMKRRYGIDL